MKTYISAQLLLYSFGLISFSILYAVKNPSPKKIVAPLQIKAPVKKLIDTNLKNVPVVPKQEIPANPSIAKDTTIPLLTTPTEESSSSTTAVTSYAPKYPTNLLPDANVLAAVAAQVKSH